MSPQGTITDDDPDDTIDAPPTTSILTVLQARRADIDDAETPSDIAAE
jgi:hypothetical protein